MGLIRQKYNSLKQNCKKLSQMLMKQPDDMDLDSVIKCLQEIIETASFLKQYKDLDKEREEAVKQTVMVYMNDNDTYDSAFLKCIEYCFSGESD